MKRTALGCWAEGLEGRSVISPKKYRLRNGDRAVRLRRDSVRRMIRDLRREIDGFRWFLYTKTFKNFLGTVAKTLTFTGPKHFRLKETVIETVRRKVGLFRDRILEHQFDISENLKDLNKSTRIKVEAIRCLVSTTGSLRWNLSEMNSELSQRA